jgi:hypothetical protein
MPTMVMTAAAINIGFESMLFWAFAKVIAIQRGVLLHDEFFERLRRAIPLERGLALGAVLLLVGLMTSASPWPNGRMRDLVSSVEETPYVLLSSAVPHSCLGHRSFTSRSFCTFLITAAAPRVEARNPGLARPERLEAPGNERSQTR